MTISQKELAMALGIDPSVVTRLKAKGMPVHSLAAAIAWREAHVRPRVAEARSEPTKRLTSPGGRREPERPVSGPRADPLPPDYLESRARREAAEAELAELKLATEKGNLVRMADISAALAKKVTSARDSLLNMAFRLAPLLAAELDTEKVSRTLEEAIHEALSEISRPSPALELPPTPPAPSKETL